MLEVRSEYLAGSAAKAGSSASHSYREEELEALDRLFASAEGSTLEASRCAVFLLGWYYPAEVGGIDLSRVGWKVSPFVAVDLSMVFALMVRLQQRGLGVTQLGHDARARSLLVMWFPEVLGMAPVPPTGHELKAFRRRHDLAVQDCAELVRVPLAIYKEWERDEHPIPLALWIELRALMGERRSGLTRLGLAAEGMLMAR